MRNDNLCHALGGSPADEHFKFSVCVYLDGVTAPSSAVTMKNPRIRPTRQARFACGLLKYPPHFITVAAFDTLSFFYISIHSYRLDKLYIAQTKFLLSLIFLFLTNDGALSCFCEYFIYFDGKFQTQF